MFHSRNLRESGMNRFTDRAVIVTGAASGIGEATARRFGAEGARVTCADVNAEGVEATAAAIREAYARSNSGT
jgi:NAD(P)-dependent dehydrogenase (short-subunit alcohol dehydrogenase family)